jgi:uncharacterized membrane protein YkvA (DUF1232 family)
MNQTERLSFGSRLLRYLKDPKVAVWRKWSGLLAAIYVVWPIDLVPDVIPVVGWLDDLGVLALMAGWMVREVNRHGSVKPGVSVPRR